MAVFFVVGYEFPGLGTLLVAIWNKYFLVFICCSAIFEFGLLGSRLYGQNLFNYAFP